MADPLATKYLQQSWVTVMGNLLLSVASFSVTSVVNEA